MRSSRPSPDLEPRRTLYGRRKGRPLRKRQRELIAALLPELDLAVAKPGQNGAARSLSPHKMFPRLGTSQTTEIGLEIGFGGGEHLLAQALQSPGMGFIGCEPYENGVAKLLASIDSARHRGVPVENVRICREDGRALLGALPDQCLRRVFLLFPDPWPKMRHHKRRFITPDTVGELTRVLSDGGELRVATDHPGYCRWALFHVTGSAAFLWQADGPDGWRRRPSDWPETRYEAKAKAAGRPCYYLSFRRLPRSEEGPNPGKFAGIKMEKP